MTSEERRARAEFDAFELRKTRMLRPEISLDGLITVLEGSKRKGEAFAAARCAARDAGGRESSARYGRADKCRVGGENAGVPGGRGMGFGFAARAALSFRRGASGRVRSMSWLRWTSMECRSSLCRRWRRWRRIARQTTFAPESRDAPVQVMGPLEAAGGTFDAVWFLRGGELSWPMETQKQFPAAVGDAAGTEDAGHRRRAGQRSRRGE